MTRPGGYLSKPEQARRLVILRELWAEGRPVVLIAERLHVSPGTVSWLAGRAGLPSRVNRGGRRRLDNQKSAADSPELKTST